MEPIKVELTLSTNFIVSAMKGKEMDPRISEKNVPSYRIVEEKIREIDNTIIIARTYYIYDNFNFAYRFQLIKKDKLCIIDIPKKLLDDLRDNNEASEEELTRILNLHLQRNECWMDFEK